MDITNNSEIIQCHRVSEEEMKMHENIVWLFENVFQTIIGTVTRSLPYEIYIQGRFPIEI